jgi:hypothetical protein
MIELNWLLLGEIERTRAQLVRLRAVLTTRREESTSRMDQCEEANASERCQAATTQAVQLGVEVKVDNREPRSSEVRSKSQDRSCRAGNQ